MADFHPLELVVDLNEWNKVHAERDALRAEIEDYASQITTLEWQLSEATKAAELAQAQYHHSTQGRVAMQTKIDALRAEVERAGIDMRAWKIRAETAEAEAERLRADIETWGQIWNDDDLLAARVEALRDGTASQS